MLQTLRTLAKLFGALLMIFLAQITAVYLLPFPFNRINIALLTFLWLIVYRNNLSALWLALIISLTTDLFSSLPFGLTALAMISTIVVTRRIFEIFSNFSWYNIFFLGALGIFFYEIFSYALLLTIYFFYKKTDVLQLPNLTYFASEIFINALSLLIAYAISLLFTKRKITYHSL